MKNIKFHSLLVYATTCLIWLVSTFYSGTIVYGQTQALCLVEEIADSGMDAAGNTVTKLQKGSSVSVSPDGKSVYVVGIDNGIVVFSRNTTTGVLTLVEEIADGSVDAAGNPVTELFFGKSVNVSPDGNSVYVVGDDRAIVVFSRNTTTGVLTIVEEIADGGMDAANNTVNELNEGRSVNVSPDGKNVYVVGNDAAIVVFSRNTTTGALTLIEEITDGGMDAANNTVNKLAGGQSVSVSPDGKSVYVVGNDDAIVVFSRNTTTGVLTLVEEIADGGTDAAGNTVNKLINAQSVSVSPDGKNVYVVGEDHAIVVFSRNTTTGVLTLIEELADGGMDAAGNTINRLNGGRSVSVSSDGKSVYIVGDDDAIVAFSRNTTTGVLTLVEEIADSGMDAAGNTINRLGNGNSLSVSPDGKSVYVVGLDNAIVSFERICADLSSSDGDNTICAGDNVTFTASSGSMYEFFLNNTSVQNSTSTTYSTTTLANGNKVKVTVKAANGCTVTSSEITTTVNAPTPGLSSSDADNTICSGDNVTFTGTGGTNYQFFLNNSSVQNSTSTTYSNNALANGDKVKVTVTDANSCTATSSEITTTVNAPIPGLSSSDADNTICLGDNVTFTATGGTNYQFFLNNSSVQNSATATYSNNALANGDKVKVTVTDVNSCTATSSEITTTVTLKSLAGTDTKNIGLNAVDPCSCTDPLNRTVGDVFLFHDVFTVTSAAGRSIWLSVNDGEFRDANNAPFPAGALPTSDPGGNAGGTGTGTLIPETATPGTYQLEFYHRENIASTISYTDGTTTEVFITSSCTICQAPIPTMSQWGLLIFGLLVMNLGVFFVQLRENHRVE